MANKYQSLPGDESALFSSMQQSKNKDEFRRYQSVWLRLSKGLSFKYIADITCYSESWVRQLHTLYRKGGLEAILVSPKGGRHNENMSLEEEDAFIAPFLETSKSGGILEVGKIHRAYEKKLGRKVSVSVVYLLLHRHDWRKITPRPQHPKTDIEAQNTFKKTGPPSSKRQKKKQNPREKP